jgi:methionyl-tRNA formyltransferase
MRIIFAGTPPNAARTLDALVSKGFNVVGVVTREDALVGRNKVLSESAVAKAAKEHGIPTLKSKRGSEEVLSFIGGLKPDLGVIVAYGSILRKPVLEAPVLGWINLHYSLLPKFPGAAPIQHAILSGAVKTGVSVFRLDEGIDTGPILNQAEVEIEPQITSGQLLEKLTEVGSNLLLDTLADFKARISSQQTQLVPTGEAVASKISRPMARVNFQQPAALVHNFVRAMNPEPMAWFEFQQTQVRVLKTVVSSQANLAPGEGAVVAGHLLVGCSVGSLELVQVQPAGKNEMSGADWFRGLRQESISLI